MSTGTISSGSLPLSREVEVKAKDLFGWFFTLDHKRLGLMYMITAGFFFCVAGFEALLMRYQLAWPKNTFMGPDAYDQTFTMHGTTMIFLVVVPVLLGLSVYLVPLMIGATDMAFPRLNAYGYWIYLFSGLLLYYSYFAGGAPDAGWFAYTPLSEKPYSFHSGTDYWALALLILGTGTVGTGLNLIVTILSLRAPGLTVRRLPLFVWMVLVNSFLIIFALPALNASLVMLLFDRLLNGHFFRPYGGGDPILWQHFFWNFGHPEVYIMILPAWGAISEIIPVFSRKPIFGYSYIAGSTVAIGLLSFGVWAHHMFAVGLGHPWDYSMAASSMLIAVPTGIKIFNWIATMWGGAIRFTTSMMFAVAFLIEFTMGGLSGVTFAVVPADWLTTDTYYVVAHFHYVLFGGTLFAVFAGLYYWFPKFSGRMLSEKLGIWHFWLTVIGFNATFLVQHVLGIWGMARRVYTYPDVPGWALLNQISSVGAGILGIAMVVFFYNIYISAKRGPMAGNNPWDAWTLEWWANSPPVIYNYETIPPVRSRRPLWDLNHPEDPDYGTGAGGPTPRPVRRLAGISKAKLMMGFFLASEFVFFVFLILAYIDFQNAYITAGPTAHKTLHPATTGIYTAFLLASSPTMWWAEKMYRKGRARQWRLWLGVTIAFALVFLYGEGREWAGMLSKGIDVGANLFGTTFFTLTGFHAFHLIVGTILMGTMLRISWKHGLGGGRQDTAVAAIGLYWHFVDAMWVFIFSVIYLWSALT